MKIRKRYSEFDKLRDNLTLTFPNSEAALPKLPPKSLLFRFDQKFLNKRQQGLQYFLNCVLLNPEFSASPVMKEFLFSWRDRQPALDDLYNSRSLDTLWEFATRNPMDNSDWLSDMSGYCRGEHTVGRLPFRSEKSKNRSKTASGSISTST